MKLITLVASILLTIQLFSQKKAEILIKCPGKLEVERRIEINNLSLNVVFNDERYRKKPTGVRSHTIYLSKKRKPHCDKNDLFKEFSNSLVYIFPNIEFKFLDETKFNENPEKGEITLKITLLTYESQMTFYSKPPMCSGFITFNVEVFDYRHEEIVYKKEYLKGDYWGVVVKSQSGQMPSVYHKRAITGSYNIIFNSLSNLITKLE